MMVNVYPCNNATRTPKRPRLDEHLLHVGLKHVTIHLRRPGAGEDRLKARLPPVQSEPCKSKLTTRQQLMQSYVFTRKSAWNDAFADMAAAQNVRSGSSPGPTHDPDLRSRPPIQTFRKDLIQTFDPDLWNDII